MKLLQELLGLNEQKFDVYVPHSYGSGFMDEPLEGGEYLTDEAGNEWEFISVTKDGKKLTIARNGKKQDVSPSKFGADIRPKGGATVNEAGRTFTIKNDTIKPRGAPEVKARAFDKVNPKTGARPDRSVLGTTGKGLGKYFALEFADEVDFITVHVVRDDVELRDRAKDPNDNYEGIHVIFTPDGKISGDTYDVTSKRQWVADKDKIVAVAKAALKDEHLSGQYAGLMGREVKRGKHKLSFDTDNHTIDPDKKMHRHHSD